MRLAVFGATGRTGGEIVQQALASGHMAVASARDPSKLGIAHEHLTVVQGGFRRDGAMPHVIRHAPSPDPVGPTPNRF